MKFAFCGTDMFLGVLMALIRAGHQPVAVHVPKVDSGWTTQILDFCRNRGLPVVRHRVTVDDMILWQKDDCEMLVVAGYPHKIPPWRDHLPVAVNVHPSPLPLGRGPEPCFRAILGGVEDWGVTLHLISEQWDAGDIVLTRTFALGPAETAESLLARCQLSANALMRRFLEDPAKYLAATKPQGEGVWFTAPTEEDRHFALTDSVISIDRKLRAFTAAGCLTNIAGRDFLIRRAHAWATEHTQSPGAIIAMAGPLITIAVADGFLTISDAEPVQ